MSDRPSWWRRWEPYWPWAVVLGFVLVIVVPAAVDYGGYGPDWFGFRESTTNTKETTRDADEPTLSDGSVVAVDIAQDPQRAKTLWDWEQLLIVPLALAIGAFLLNRAQRLREERVEARREQDSALQAYLDEMSKLLVEDQLRREHRRHGDTRVTARARTLTVLSQLDDRNHKRRVLQFLREARLISSKELHYLEGRPAYPRIVGLEDADLRRAKLDHMKLEDADLGGADLSGADLTNANLKNANLSGTDLRGARLQGADLQGANLLGVKVLAKEDLEQAIGDKTTNIARNLRPEAWSDRDEEPRNGD